MSAPEYRGPITISLTRLWKAVNHFCREGNVFLHDWLSSISESHITILLAQNGLVGILIIGAIIFCETGLVFAPFLPGDSLIFTAGAFLGTSHISPVVPWMILGFSAVLGDGLNYSMGRSAWGKKIMTKKLLKPQHVIKIRRYFERYGAATILIGRFIPIVRSIAPFLAGLSDMRIKTFVIYNVVGAFTWCGIFLALGYFLGDIAWVQNHMSIILILIIVISLLPAAYQMLRKTEPERP